MVTPTYHFDVNLRETPDSWEEWEVYLENLKTAFSAAANSLSRLQLLEAVGVASRILQNFEEAEMALNEAVSLSQGTRQMQNKIRLAHVYQWKKDFILAQRLFDEVEQWLQHNECTTSFVASFHQHLGKLYFDQHSYGRAQAQFALAFNLRSLSKAPEDQVKSSQMSLQEAQSRWGRHFVEGIVLRRAVTSDAEGIHHAHMQSIQLICSKDHSPDEIQAWGYRPYQEDRRIHAIKKDKVWVVEYFGKIEGYGHLRIFEKEGMKQAYVYGLYLTPKVSGQQLGKSVLDIMLEEITAAEARLVTLDATISARDFYRRAGFVECGGIMSVEINGTPIRCYPMKMEI